MFLFVTVMFKYYKLKIKKTIVEISVPIFNIYIYLGTSIY